MSTMMMCCTGLYWPVVDSFRPNWALLGCIGLYRALLGFAGLLWTVLDCTESYWAVLGCIGLYWAVL